MSRELAYAFTAGDEDKIRRMCQEDPQLTLTRDYLFNATWLQKSAEIESRPLIEMFLEAGVDINATDSGGYSALSKAGDTRNMGFVKWLVVKGADCTNESAMVNAVSGGLTEIVKLLVDNGADIHFEFGVPLRTPFSQAEDFGHSETAEYLRSLGGKRPAVEAADDDPRVNEIHGYFAHHTGAKRLALGAVDVYPGQVSVSVWSIDKGDERIIYTCGASFEPYNCPSGQDEYQYCELMMHLPKDWPLNPPTNSPEIWPTAWLRTIAKYAHESESWLGGPVVATFTNDDPPERLDPNTEFTGFVLAYNRSYPSFHADDGRLINSVTVMPVYTEELKLIKKKGFPALLVQFDEHSVPTALVPNRKNFGHV